MNDYDYQVNSGIIQQFIRWIRLNRWRHPISNVNFISYVIEGKHGIQISCGNKYYYDIEINNERYLITLMIRLQEIIDNFNKNKFIWKNICFI